ncbi:hypothetical protein [Streptomyces sp. NPDC055642]
MHQLQCPVALGADSREVTVPTTAGAHAGGVYEVEFMDDLVPGVEERLVALENLVVEGGLLLETEGVAAADEVGATLDAGAGQVLDIELDQGRARIDVDDGLLGGLRACRSLTRLFDLGLGGVGSEEGRDVGWSAETGG